MNKTACPFGKVGFASALMIVLAGCTTCIEERPPGAVYTPPPLAQPAPPPAAVSAEMTIRSESDFVEPLSPHGEWVVVGSYGRCWRPQRVDAGWRPYCNGYWQQSPRDQRAETRLQAGPTCAGTAGPQRKNC